jgi:flagellar motor switch protein FliM
LTSNVAPEEAEALRDMVNPPDGDASPQQVKSRNFSEPRRLSRQRLRRLEREGAAIMNSVSTNLAVPLRGYHKLKMGAVKELNVAGLFDDLQSPFVIMNFVCRDQPAWMIWESSAAVAACETILGSDLDGDAEARSLSESECLVIKQLLGMIAEPTMKAVGFDYMPETARLSQELEQLSTLEDWGPDADTQRLMVHLSFEGPGGSSELRLYLPGIEPEVAGNEKPNTNQAPKHLDGVRLEVRAFLASVDIPLNDLLSLEAGDVIPLGINAGAPLKLFVEDRICATAKWGKHGPNLAVRIEELCHDDQKFDQPDGN